MAGSKGNRGGRGGSNVSGVVPERRAISVRFSDGTHMRYEDVGGTIYETSGDIPREINTPLTFEQLEQNATNLGAKVVKLTQKDLEEIEAANAKLKAEMFTLLQRQEFSLKKYYTSKTRARRSAP